MKLIQHPGKTAALEVLDEMMARCDHPAIGLYREQVEAAFGPPPSVGQIDAERLASEQTTFLRNVLPLGKAPVSGFNRDGQFALFGAFKTSTGRQENLVLVLPEGFPETPPEVFHIKDGASVPVDLGIKESWTVNDNCAFVLDEAKKNIERSLEETEDDDETV